MDEDQVRRLLDDPGQCTAWLGPLGVQDVRRGYSNLQSIATGRLTLDLVAVVCRSLAEQLPLLSDPDMALNNLERFVAASRTPLALGGLFERDTNSLPILLQIFSTSQYLSELLITDSESYDLLRMTEGHPVARDVLVDEICSEVAAAADEVEAMTALRRLKHRETLRIAYGDIIRSQPLETVTAQISHLAEAILEAAVRSAQRRLEKERGTPAARMDLRPGLSC